jgi:catalase
VANYTSAVTDEDFEQPKELWRLFKEWKQDQVFIDNLSGHMKKALPQVQKDAIKVWAKVDQQIADRLTEALGDYLSDKGVDHVSNTPYGLQPAYGGGY